MKLVSIYGHLILLLILTCSYRLCQGQVANPNFTVGSGADGTIKTMVNYYGDKLLVGGDFTSFNGVASNGLVVLSTRGALDHAFAQAIGTGFNGTVHSLQVQSDGTILAAGEFTSFNGFPVRNIVRLLINGSTVASYRTNYQPDLSAGEWGPDGLVRKVLEGREGKLLVMGDFSRFDGRPVNGLVRLLYDGTVDESFAPAISAIPRNIALQTDGKLLVSLGERNGIVRLNTNGSLDDTFVSGTTDAAIEHVGVLGDGRIWVSGSFSQYNGSNRSFLAMLTGNGSLDYNFYGYVNGVVSTILEVGVNGLLLTGNFSLVNGQPRNNVAMLRGFGYLDSNFNIGTGTNGAVKAVAQYYSIYMAGDFTSVDGKPAAGVAQLDGRFNPPAKPQITASSSLLCTGSSVTLTAPSGYYYYYWSNGAFTYTNTLQVSQPGAYTVKVALQNSDYSQASEPVTIIENTVTKPVLTLSGPADFCSGSSITITAPAGYAGYEWYNGAGYTSQQSITVTSGGTYTVRVKDQFGCLSVLSDPVSVRAHNAPPTPTITRSTTDVLTASGSGTFEWKKDGQRLEQATASLQATGLGAYSVRVKSPVGCVSDSTVFIIGTLQEDPSFNAGASTAAGSANGSVFDMLIQPDDKIILAGDFTTFNGRRANRLIRLMPDGSIDQAFLTKLGTGFNGQVTSIALLSDGKILLGGPFKMFNNVTAHGVVRLHPDGSRDISFTTTQAVGYNVQKVVSMPGGKVLAGGCAGMHLLNPDGSPDLTYKATLPTWVKTFGMQADGKQLIAYQGNPRRMTRLNINGSTDNTFNPGTGGAATYYDFCLQDDGKLLVGGDFGSFYNSGYKGIVRLNTNGTVDRSFYSSKSPGFFAIGSIHKRANGKYLIGGYLRSYAGRPMGGFAQINADGTLDQAFSGGMTTTFFDIGIDALSEQSNGKIIIYVAESTPNGRKYKLLRLINEEAAPAKPVITNSSPLSLCQGGSVTLSAPAGFAGYLWSNGSTTTSIQVSQAGSYWVKVKSAKNIEFSSQSEPVVVTVDTLSAKPLIVTSGSTTFCAGDSVQLTAPEGYASYQWSQGSTTRTIIVRESGEYTVKGISRQGCESPLSEPISVTVHSLPVQPQISTSGNTTFCPGESVTLLAPAGFAGYLWSDGSTTTSIQVSQSGSYWVKVVNANGCQSPVSLALPITVYSTPSTPQITLLHADTLMSNQIASSYEWRKDGVVLPESDQKIRVIQAGVYSLRVQNQEGCFSPEVIFTFVPASPTPGIAVSGPLTFCKGDSVVLTASEGYEAYKWSTGATSRSINVFTSGIYSVRATKANATYSQPSDSITLVVEQLPQTPQLLLTAPDTLAVNTEADSYEWRLDGQVLPIHTQKIYLNQPGHYSVRVKKGCFSEYSPEYHFVLTATEPIIPVAAVRVYPNPTTGILHLDAGEQLDKVDILLFNMLGKVVYQISNVRSQTDAKLSLPNSLPRGVYLMKIYSKKGSSTHKIRLH